MIKRVLALALGAALLYGCEAEKPGEPSYQEEYLGVWDVTEKTGVYAPQIYSVNVQSGSTENEIVINGLYNLPDVEVVAEISGYSLSISNQTSEGIQFSGSGTANADFDQLNLQFTANDGSVNDQVSAVFTR